MKAKNLIKLLKKLPEDADIKVANDEELNKIYEEFEIGKLEEKEFVIFGLTEIRRNEN